MLRYCKNCQKDFDFEPRAVSSAKDLICPECGTVIPKNSRNPMQGIEAERSEERVGHIFGVFLHFAYIYYLTLAVLGIIGFFTGLHGLLVITAAISLLSYAVQKITDTTNFSLGIILIPAGAIIAGLYFQSVEGALLGVHIVFLIRHLIRDIILRIIFWFVDLIARHCN
ncbi:MAG: hypothetical protein K6G60_06940 [Lachnospiraceae bacterium]|nr:hypothetical protein [Lachnospiraceae bacterium]